MTTNANNDFERHVKSSLDGYEAPYTPADWDDMESKLNTLPKYTPSFSLRWNFSMNVIVAIVACSGIFFLVYKMNGTTHEVGAPVSKIATTVKLTPPSDRATIPVPPTPPKPVSGTGEALVITDSTYPVTSDSLHNADGVREVASVDEEKRSSDKQASGQKSGTGPRDKTPLAIDPIQTPLVSGSDEPRVRIFGDMLDPKKGFIYNTKEKVGTDPVDAQTKVNLGWNDYVIYDPNRAKNTDSLKNAQPVVSPDVSSTSGNQSSTVKAEKKSRVLRRQRGNDKTNNTPATSAAEKPKEPAKESPAVVTPTKEGGDTVKRVKLKNPKYKADHSMLDPY